MSKKNYYAVLVGRNPGIYTEWSGPDGAESQITQFPGAMFRGFKYLHDAEKWLKDSEESISQSSMVNSSLNLWNCWIEDQKYINVLEGALQDIRWFDPKGTQVESLAHAEGLIDGLRIAGEIAQRALDRRKEFYG